MKHVVQSATVLALIGALAPSTYAVSIKDDTVSLGVKLVIQNRLQVLNDASTATGGEYDPLRGTTGEAEAARFYIRRARLTLDAKYQEVWRLLLTLRAGERSNLGAADVSPAAQLYYARLGRIFKQDSLEHEAAIGLYKPFNAESSISSSNQLFPAERLVGEQIEERRVGIGYILTGGQFRVGVDVMNNGTVAKDPQAANNAGEEPANGYFYSARIEFSPLKEWWSTRKLESWAGGEGQHLIIGFDVQSENDVLTSNDVAAATPTPTANTNFVEGSYLTFGPDILFHWGAITALAELRIRNASNDTVVDATGATTSTDIDATFWNIQAAYAHTLDSGIAIEPALGFAVYDGNKDVDTNTVYGAGSDNAVTSKTSDAGSGTTINAAVNIYFNGHANKLQIGFQNWSAEEGDGDANIVRIQHQISF